MHISQTFVSHILSTIYCLQSLPWNRDISIEIYVCLIIIWRYKLKHNVSQSTSILIKHYLLSTFTALEWTINKETVLLNRTKVYNWNQQGFKDGRIDDLSSCSTQPSINSDLVPMYFILKSKLCGQRFSDLNDLRYATEEVIQKQIMVWTCIL